MLQIRCPQCGEEEMLSGRPNDDSSITVTCGVCGEVWSRDPRLRCRLCGSDNLEYTPRPLWERGRGQQRTPAGRFDAYACLACGGHDVTGRALDPG